MWKAAGGEIIIKLWVDRRDPNVYWTATVKCSPDNWMCLELLCQNCGHQRRFLEPFGSLHSDKIECSQKYTI